VGDASLHFQPQLFELLRDQLGRLGLAVRELRVLMKGAAQLHHASRAGADALLERVRECRRGLRVRIRVLAAQHERQEEQELKHGEKVPVAHADHKFWYSLRLRGLRMRVGPQMRTNIRHSLILRRRIALR
jgi:hypothetical protein